MTIRLGLALALVAAALSSCATPQDRRVAEADRTWRCAASRPLPGGRIEASVSLTRAGTPQAPIEFVWRQEVAAEGTIRLQWYEADDRTEPQPATGALLSFRIGLPDERVRRLELRRARPDGSAGEIVYASPFERLPSRVYARWSDVLAAARDGAFFAVVADRQGDVLAQTRVERNVVDQPSRAAAMLLPQMRAMIGDYERQCQLSSDREEQIIIT